MNINKTKIYGIGVVISFALLIILFSQISISDVISVIVNINYMYLVIGFIIYSITYLLRSVRFFFLLNKEVKIFDLYSIVCLHNFFNNLLPARTGELSYIFLLKEISGKKSTDGIITLFVARIFDVFSIGCLFILIVLSLHDLSYSIQMMMQITIIFLTILLCVGFIFIKFESKIIPVISSYLNWFSTQRSIHKYNIYEKIREIYTQLKLILKKGNYLLFVLILTSVCIWLLQYLMMYCIAISMNIHVGLISILFASSFTFLTSILPIQGIAGFGTTEAGWTLGFILIGLPQELAVSTGIAFHFILIFYFITLGIWGLIGWKFNIRIK